MHFRLFFFFVAVLANEVVYINVIKNISCDVCSVSKCYVIILHVAAVYRFLVMSL